MSVESKLDEILVLLRTVLGVTKGATDKLQDSRDEVPVLKTAIPVTMYDKDNKNFKNFGTWEQEQTYKNDITLAVGKKIKFGDGDTYIVESSDDDLEFWRAGVKIVTLKFRGGQNVFELPNNTRFYVADTKETYMKSLSAGQGYQFYANSVKIVEMFDSGIFFKKNLAVQSPGYLLMQELAVNPGTSGGFGKIWPKADNELYYRDGDGNLFTIDKTAVP